MSSVAIKHELSYRDRWQLHELEGRSITANKGMGVK